MSEQIGTRAFLNRLKDNVPQWGEKLPEIPSLVHEVLHQARHGKLEVKTNSEELQKIRREIRRANRRTFFAILAGSLIISASLLLGLIDYAPQTFLGIPKISWALGILGTLLLLLNWPETRD